MNTRHAWHIIVLLICVAAMVPPATGEAAPATWAALQEECTQAGVESKLVKQLITRCREQGIALEDARLMLTAAVEAAHAGLPCPPVMEKIAEGVGKGIAPATVADVAHQRVKYLQDASEMLRSVEDKLASEEAVVAAAQAIESGLAEDAAKAVVEAGRESSPKDLTALLEAGEALYLAGFASDEIPPILTDCLDRRLNRVELKRAIRYASQQKQRGMETRRIREALWGGADGGAQQQRHREQNGQGSGGGQGPGGPRHGRGHP